jgi:peptidoglycan/LPS O-acetylase OafA/YrhL
MFGYLRFFLAFFVLISHLDVRFFYMNPGVVAVVMFYLLAGHVVCHLWENVLPDGSGRLWRFYRDRLLRIMPLYLYIIVLTLAFLFVTGYGNPQYSFLKLLGNLLVVPVNYYMILDTTILTDPPEALIPVAWSLGAELQAYLILPLLLWSRGWKICLITGSFAVYMLANTGVLQTDYFGYRLIPGVFFMFAAGACIQRTGRRFRHPVDLVDRVFPWLLWGVAAVLFWQFWTRSLFEPVGYTRETLLGLILGIPLVVAGSRTRIRLPGNALMGSLSYGVFLSHFLVKWGLDHAGIFVPGTALHILAVTLGSVLIAFCGVKVLETRVDRIRKNEK